MTMSGGVGVFVGGGVAVVVLRGNASLKRFQFQGCRRNREEVS